MATEGRTRLIITADDYGYSRRYDAGILRAAGAGAIDAASAMVLRPALRPEPLLATGVEIGLHLEAAGRGETPAAAISRQLEAFEAAFGRPPSYLDGHHHCHAGSPMEEVATEAAARLGVRVRPASAEHGLRLRDAGLMTPDRLIGRYEPQEAPVPPEVAAVEEGGEPPAGLTEWMVHPGLADPAAGSSYDAAREEDLAELLRLAGHDGLRAWRRVAGWSTGPRTSSSE